MLIVLVFSLGCTTTRSQVPEWYQLAKVNDNWNVNCTVDPVTTSRRCFASTFGQMMGHDGRPYGEKSIPFQVYFFDTLGPFVMVGWHTYPGRYPIVRVDDNTPITVRDDGGVSTLEPEPFLVEQLRLGKVARAQFHSWPEGCRNMFIDLAGFEEAWQRLVSYVFGR